MPKVGPPADSRDEFAADPPLQRGVACEPEDDIDTPVRRGSTITIRSRSTTSRRDNRVAERLSRMPYRPRGRGQRPLKGPGWRFSANARAAWLQGHGACLQPGSGEERDPAGRP